MIFAAQKTAHWLWGPFINARRMCFANGPGANPRRSHRLWSHQVESLQSLDQIRAQGHRSAYIEIGTGGGKTLVAAQDALSYLQRKSGTRCLWLAHRQELLDQAEETFRDLAPEARILRPKRSLAKHNPELYDHDVVIASKQSVERCLDSFPRTAFHYFVIDEAHHAYAEGYQRIIAHLSPDFMLGITATPRRFSDRKHIRDLFGPCAIKINLLELIQAGILIDNVRFRKVETNIEVEAKLLDSGEFNLPHFWNQIKATKRNNIVADTYLESPAGKRKRPAITFCVSIEHAKAMAALYKRRGIKAEALHGKLSGKRRGRILDDFESGRLTMLTCVDILNEGYDFPPIEVILMARPTRSKTIWLQQMGRGTRKSPSTGKQELLVFDFVDNLSAFQKQITFEEIFKPTTAAVPRPTREASALEIRRDALVENVIDMDIEEVFNVIPLQAHELTGEMLARRIPCGNTTIRRAIDDGRLKPFIKRTTRITGHEVSVFMEKEVDKIRAALHYDQTPVQPGELTVAGLSKRTGVSASAIRKGVKDGRLNKYIKRTIIIRQKLRAPVFNEADADKIKQLMTASAFDLELAEGEITTGDLARLTGVSRSQIFREIKNGRISGFVRRTVPTRGKTAYIFHGKDADRIKTILATTQDELTAGELASELGVARAVIVRNTKTGALRIHVKRWGRYRGHLAPIFAKKDLPRIRTLLRVPQTGELTISTLSGRIGVSGYLIKNAIRTRSLDGFISRTFKRSDGQTYYYFHEQYLEKIKRALKKQ